MNRPIETAADIALAQLSCVATQLDSNTTPDVRLKVANAAIRLTQALTREHLDLEALPDTFVSPSGLQDPAGGETKGAGRASPLPTPE